MTDIPDRLPLAPFPGYWGEWDIRDYTAGRYGWGPPTPPGPATEGLPVPYGLPGLDRGYVRKIFNRPLEPGENPIPTAESQRASRSFEGVIKLIPRVWLDAIEIPLVWFDRYYGEYVPLTELILYKATARAYRRGDPTPAIDVHILPAPTPPSTYVVPLGQLPILAAARDAQLFEIAVRPYYRSA